MTFPKHVYEMSIDVDWLILYFKVSKVVIFKSVYISVVNICFYRYQQSRPWLNAALCLISYGPSLFAKVHVCRYPV